MSPLLNKPGEVSDIANGIAGQGLATIMCAGGIDSQESADRLQQYLSTILGQQQKDGSWLFNAGKNKLKTITGFSNGIAGIIYFLLCHGEHSGNQEAVKAAEKGLQWLINKAISHGNKFNWSSSSAKS
ncbi:lanthionine synthetase LanC family protein [Chitinophaga pinensis]|uniref:lanthionine synthetase LanC family protein n=1 Tax=Chitinophaga pinensis TaxID=79329 RepID=UPI0021BD5698|nr:lanthionine synthetase LanC family protein [Chitinophaga pinensis]